MKTNLQVDEVVFKKDGVELYQIFFMSPVNSGDTITVPTIEVTEG